MQRSALVLTLALLVLCGCEKPAAELETDRQDTYATAMDSEPFLVDPAADMPADAEPATYTLPETELTTTAAPRTHQVAKGDTLYSLARRYYNNERRWKDIYEANRDRLSSPDSLRIDQVVVIP